MPAGSPVPVSSKATPAKPPGRVAENEVKNEGGVEAAPVAMEEREVETPGDEDVAAQPAGDQDAVVDAEPVDEACICVLAFFIKSESDTIRFTLDRPAYIFYVIVNRSVLWAIR